MAASKSPVAKAEPVLEGTVVVAPDLVFVTSEKDREDEPEEDRRFPFEVDGVEYTAIRPVKLEETLAGLVEASARRATTADAMWAGSEFLRRVIVPESLARLQQRLDDDKDPFEITDLYDILTSIVGKLAAGSRKQAPQPAQARARR